jgi:hypothetical protein
LSESKPQEGAPREVIGGAIQIIMVARLGRGFVPTGILFAVGAVQFARGAGLVVGVGAVLTSAAMLAYGLRIVQNAFGRPTRWWTSVAVVGSIIPPLFSVYVIGWEGLRRLAPGGGLGGIAAAIILAGLGVWVLRSWMRVVEVERLARVMAVNMDEGGGPA